MHPSSNPGTCHIRGHASGAEDAERPPHCPDLHPVRSANFDGLHERHESRHIRWMHLMIQHFPQHCEPSRYCRMVRYQERNDAEKFPHSKNSAWVLDPCRFKKRSDLKDVRVNSKVPIVADLITISLHHYFPRCFLGASGLGFCEDHGHPA